MSLTVTLGDGRVIQIVVKAGRKKGNMTQLGIGGKVVQIVQQELDPTIAS